MAYFNSLYSSFMCYNPLDIPYHIQTKDGPGNEEKLWAN